LLGAAFVVLIVLPLISLFAKAGLVLLERDEVGGPLHGLNLRYVLLTASSVLPLAWFFSAGLHQVETGQSALACLLDHDEAALCFEPGFFAMMLAIGVTVAWWRAVRGGGYVRASTSEAACRLATRIDHIIEKHGALSGLRGRIVITEDAGFALGTHGLIHPRVLVSTAFAAELTDSMLASALGHENEHVRSFDPLRYLLLELALSINPLGRFLLAPHVARWKAAREAHCDREAVLHGAAPLPLADAIVRAARTTTREAVALGVGDTAVLKLRIGMLLAFAEHAPHRCCNEGRSAIAVALVLLFIALILPHQTGTFALDALHTGTEHALTYFWR
jgi:hypothetical protein